MVDVFTEVDDELKNEEMNKWLKKFAPKVIALAIIVVLFTAGRVLYSNYEISHNEEQTEILSVVVNNNSSELMSLEGSHKLLANFAKAGDLVDEGKSEEANSIYKDIMNDKDIDKEYTDLASIYFVQNTLNQDGADLKEAHEVIKGFLNKESVYFYVASELNALIELKNDNVEIAKAIFTTLSNDYDAPEEIRSRAEKIRTLY
jgi:hypothetical protein